MRKIKEGSVYVNDKHKLTVVYVDDFSVRYNSDMCIQQPAGALKCSISGFTRLINDGNYQNNS